jgi:hypothetical protein
MKINKKFESYIFTTIMAFGMSLMMSFIISLMNIGFVDHFFSIWIRAWIPAFFIALSPAFFMGKLAKFVLSRIIDR